MKLFVFLILFVNSIYGFSKDLVVGVITSAPPFAEMSVTPDGSYFFGFAIDIMNSICKQLNIQCIFSPLTLNTQFTALNEGKVDVVLLANPYEPAKLSSYAISLPYLISKVRFITLQNNPVKKGDPIKNFKIGVIKTTYYDLLEHTAYKNNNTIIPFGTLPDLLAALVGSKVDLILLNSDLAYYLMNNNTYGVKAVSDEIVLGQGYGIIALPSNAALITSINKAILAMQTNGTYLTIYNTYYNSN